MSASTSTALIVKHYLLYFIFSSLVLIFATLTAPIRIIFEYFNIKNPDFFRKPNDKANHKLKVKHIQDQVKNWNKNGRDKLLCSARPTWKQFSSRDMDKSKMNCIQLDLEDIVEIDTKNKVLTVEPWMKMGTLTHKLLPLGWTVPVIAEFEELTIGGLISGAGIETSSHKYGLFFQTCLGYEVVVSNGDVINCSKDENSDLFESIPMSLGTIGFITAVKLPLLPAKKFIELKYYPANNLQAAMKILQNSTHEFVEGLGFSMNKFVIIYGDFIDKVPANTKIKTFSKWNDEFYHWDTEKYFDRQAGESQIVPARDYYHRHQHGYFWAETTLLPIFKFPIVRNILGWILPLNQQLMKKLSSMIMDNNKLVDRSKQFSYFLQDFIVPIDNFEGLAEMISKNVKVSPLWLCPCKIYPTRGMFQPKGNRESLYINVGVYGIAAEPVQNFIQVWKELEQYTLKNNGFIWFYTDTFLSKDEFAQMFNDKLYMEVRKKYNCDGAFPSAYDKVKVKIPFASHAIKSGKNE